MTENNLLRVVRENKEFQALMEEVMRMRPVVPAFSICKTKDEQDMVIEAIKFNTALRQGWDGLFQYLTGKSPNNVKELSNVRSTRADT